MDDTYEFTDWSDGVRFDLNGDGAAELTSWTTQFSDDAFLVLDRNGNGTIDDYTRSLQTRSRVEGFSGSLL
jgi:hypothetical protein